MATQEPKVGLFVPLEAKPDKLSDLQEFLLQGYQLVQDEHEPETLQWFALKYAQSNTFAIFDTSAAESGRQAHLNGQVAAALGQNAPTLLAAGPEIKHVDILASKVTKTSTGGVEDVTKGLSCGLRVLLKAKSHQVQAVRDFLIGGASIVDDEPETPIWYAVWFPGTNMFGIIDFFRNEEGRNAHLAGKVAEALFASADELLEVAPDVEKVDVLAAKVK